MPRFRGKPKREGAPPNQNESPSFSISLPDSVTERLQRQGERQGTPDYCFTSDLSVNEFMLTQRAGFQALGQVMGRSVYQLGIPVGTPSGRWGQYGGELGESTRAFVKARLLALGRMRLEAILLKATGVVGVRLNRGNPPWGTSFTEFSALGTAIRPVGLSPDSARRPFLSSLSGQEFWLLHEAGYRPLDLVVGTCVYYQTPGLSTQLIMAPGALGLGNANNAELPEYTRGLYDARSLAMNRMEAAAQRLGAEGIVGVDVDVQMHPQEIDVEPPSGQTYNKRVDVIYHFTALGTAIASAESGERIPSIESQMLLG